MSLGVFTFDSAFSAGEVAILNERHQFAFGKILSCTALSVDEKNALWMAYARPIHHGIETNPRAMASAFVGGSQIFINLVNFFQSPGNTYWNEERAQTLIHEMMHCAGYTHPVRRDPPDPSPNVPGNAGPYYGTPPLRAEFCIAGRQTDLGCLPDATGLNLIYPEYVLSEVVSETD